MRKIISFVLAALLLAAPALAKDSTRYAFDPVHTQIMFSVSHLGFSHPHGRFVKFGGGFTFDPDHPEAGKVDVTVDTASIDMCSDSWDREMKGRDFFDVRKFPTMTFKSTSIRKTGDRTALMTGDLTLLGVTRPVTLAVTYNRSGIHPLTRNHVAGFSATGSLNRADFGMNYGLPGIGDKVDLDIQVEGIRQDFDRFGNK